MISGAAPTTAHTAEIELSLPPQDIKQLQRFLGMVNLPPFSAQLCIGVAPFN
jgi:hypothetical protein